MVGLGKTQPSLALFCFNRYRCGGCRRGGLVVRRQQTDNVPENVPAPLNTIHWVATGTGWFSSISAMTRPAFLRQNSGSSINATDDVAYCRILIEELIRGSEKGKGRTLPENAAVRACYITDSGTAYIDFEETAFEHHPGGIGAELLSLYSIVNTLILNSDVVSSVQLLIGGRESTTLAGHVDISRPFTANMLLVR